ncbi:ankyrin repeats (3 copies) domain-containing protein [Trichoderma breve]|uniref:Ankyrin repeats (3 copies) domain-containing protein n=1 Tax=Trichoderma breve TaxID=2034170 RepID=A0A9W9BHS6_9HYPO|nr:ankyrin repeats (3 copies) domain-containing protein [Trichoderma breve]KAJ4860026.1 ankyrin repeats (3 copies) domain-containing protein [Trichoderma breve]
MGETVLLCASGEKEASEGRSASRWAEALQRLSKEDQTQFELAQNGIDDPKSVLSNVLTATNKRKEDCMKKRWKLVIKRQTIIIRDILEKLSNWVQKLLAVGDVIIQYDPIHAALPWAAIKLIMQATINDIEIFGHVLSSLENISNLIAQCQLIEVIYFTERRKQSGELFDQLSECITCLYAAILGYLASIMHYYGLTTAAKFRRLAEISGAQELGSAVDGIQGIEQHLKDKDERDQIQDGIEQQMRTQILKAISTIPYGVHHKTASKGRLEGSGRWLLNKLAFIDWRKRSNSSVLWLHGIPGSGKTKLASLVVDEVKGKEHMAYFYCLRNPAEPHRAQCDKILASFVRQLASLTPSDPILPPVKEHYEDAIEGFVGFEDQVWTSDECVEVLIQLVDEYPAVTFVLDALDEVDQEDRQELLDALNRILQESNSLVRVFISSRSNYDIAFYLNGTPNIYIEADDNAEDISTFIDTQLTSARLLHGKLTPSLREEITDTLQEGAKGMFRWVDLQIQSLKRVKVAADLKARLGALPDTLEGSYWEIYQEIQESGEHAFELANFTFQWLLYAQESISLEALAVLACTKSKSESGTAFSSDEVLDVCSNLIVTRQNSFDFAHLSVREFFERLHNRDIHSYQSEISHAAIAAACLRYLNLAQVENRGKALREKVMNSIKEECRVDGDLNEQKKETGENTAEKDDEPLQDEVGDNAKETSQISDGEASAGQDDEEDPERTAKKVARWIEKMKDDQLKCISFEIFAVVSSDDVYGQPSTYAVTWVIDHIDKSDKYRLESPLADLIKAFMLEKSSEIGDSAHKVSRSFHVWSALMSKVIKNSNNQKELLGSAAQLPSSPIWVTCQMDWLEVAEYLYEYSYPGINDGRSMASLKSSFEVNPMWYAILSKKLNLIDYLTKCNADANRIFAVGTYSEPIVTAARRNDTELITILSKQNYGGQEAATEAFISAAGEGHCESMSLLLDLSLVTIDKVGHNALCSACAGGHLDAISLLLDKGAPTGRGAFMLYRAVLHQHIEVSRFLISKNIGLDGLSAALVTAVSNSDKECVDFLLQKGAQKEGVALVRAIRDKTSMTALGLIKAGYNVHGKYLQKRRSALHYAALLGQPKIVEALLEASADANCRDADGRTPLHLAALKGHDDCVRLLMKHGSDVLCEDSQGRIPLDLAEERDCIGAEEIIREEMERLLQRLTAKRDTT